MSVLRVVEPFACTIDGVPKVYRAGDLVRSDDKVAKGRERFFVQVEEFADRAAATQSPGGVEQATSAPGEKRGLTVPKKAAKKRGLTVPKKAAKKA